MSNVWADNNFKDKNDFITRIEAILGANVQQKTHGCKIENVLVRIGSKIHIDEFYDAEPLFHNIS